MLQGIDRYLLIKLVMGAALDQFLEDLMDILLNLKKQRTVLILLALFIFVWTQRVHIRDFFDGVFQGYAVTSADHAAAQ